MATSFVRPTCFISSTYFYAPNPESVSGVKCDDARGDSEIGTHFLVSDLRGSASFIPQQHLSVLGVSRFKQNLGGMLGEIKTAFVEHPYVACGLLLAVLGFAFYAPTVSAVVGVGFSAGLLGKGIALMIEAIKKNDVAMFDQASKDIWGGGLGLVLFGVAKKIETVAQVLSVSAMSSIFRRVSAIVAALHVDEMVQVPKILNLFHNLKKWLGEKFEAVFASFKKIEEKVKKDQAEKLSCQPEEPMQSLPPPALLSNQPSLCGAVSQAAMRSSCVPTKPFGSGGLPVALRSFQNPAEELKNTLPFDYASSRLSEESKQSLDQMLARFKRSRKRVRCLKIVGHVSSDTTTHRKNHGPLSHKRALEVWKYLVSKGFGHDLLYTEAAGDTKPIQGIDSTHPRNRRVEVTVEFYK